MVMALAGVIYLGSGCLIASFGLVPPLPTEMVDSLKTIFKGTELILCQNHLNLCLNPIIDRYRFSSAELAPKKCFQGHLE